MTDHGGNRTVFRPSPLAALKASPPPASAPDAAEPVPAPVASPAATTATSPPTTGNTMLVEAAPLLALVAGVRSGRVRMPLPQLHRQANAAVARFDGAVRAAYPEEVARRALYALCATVDDVVEHLPGIGDDGGEWARRSLVAQTFATRIGGDRFWQGVDEALRAPEAQRDLIELLHACLAAGFEDRYRALPDGRREIDAVMARLRGALPPPGVPAGELSPHWRGEQVPVGAVGAPTRVAVVSAVAAAILLLVYIALRLALLAGAGAPAAAVAAIAPDGPLRLSRGGAALAVPPSPLAGRLRAALAAEIAQHRVAIDEDAASVRVRTLAGPLFAAGSDRLLPDGEALIGETAPALRAIPGALTIEDHVGDPRAASLAFPDAMALSVARARRAAAIVAAGSADPARVIARGMGSTVPIAAAGSPDGAARNDRVEVVVPRDGGR